MYTSIWRVKSLMNLYRRVYFLSPLLLSSSLPFKTYFYGANKLIWASKYFTRSLLSSLPSPCPPVWSIVAFPFGEEW
jgi:hypothetical protein